MGEFHVQCEYCDESYPESKMTFEREPGYSGSIETLAFCPECLE